MAKIKPSRIKILKEDEQSITILFLKIDRQTQVSKYLFNLQKKRGRYKVIEEQGLKSIIRQEK